MVTAAGGGDGGIRCDELFTVSGGTVTAKGTLYGVYAGVDIIISGGSVTATGEDEGNGNGVYANSGIVSIGGPGTVVNPGGEANSGIYAKTGVIISSEIDSVTAKGSKSGSIYSNGPIVIDSPLAIMLPENGTVGIIGEVMGVLDSAGNMADEVLIAAQVLECTDSANFDSIPYDTYGGSITLTVNNLFGFDVPISGIDFTAHGGYFTYSHNGPPVIPANGSYEFILSFYDGSDSTVAPPDVGVYDSYLRLWYDNGSRLLAIPVTATVEQAREATPTLSLDFVEEKLLFDGGAGYKYRTGAGEYVTTADSGIAITEEMFGEVVEVVTLPRNGNYAESESALVSIPLRPSELDVIIGHETMENDNDGRIYNLDSSLTYEYRLKGESRWATVSGTTEISELAPGEYEIRIASVPGQSFASLINVCTIQTGLMCTDGFAATEPSFPSVVYGYSMEPSATMTLGNGGNTLITVTRIELLNPDGSATDDLTTDATLPIVLAKPGDGAEATSETVTVTGVTGLDAGTYDFTIRISYENDIGVESTEEIDCKLVVEKRPLSIVWHNIGDFRYFGDELEPLADLDGLVLGDDVSIDVVINDGAPERLGVNYAEAVISGADIGNYILPAEFRVEYVLDCNHNIAKAVPGYPATCTEPGLSDGEVCANCGEVLTAQEVIPATDHKDEDGDHVCDVCGFTKEAAVYDITLDPNGGELSGESVVKTASNGTITLPAAPTRSGYNFNGWFTAASGGEKVTAETVFSESCTIYAQWTAKSTGGGVTTYIVTVEAAAGGSVSADHVRAPRGSTVTLTVAPDEGFVLSSLSVTDGSGKAVELTELGGGKYSFKMPGSKVTVSAAFSVSAPGYVGCDGGEDCPCGGFGDLNSSAWYHDGVHFCLDEGIMNGVAENRFAPDELTTRAQLVTMLWRLEGEPIVNYLMRFEDVPAEQWYTEAVRWAAAERIVEGHSETRFAPEEPVTREQMAAIFYRYALYKGLSAVTLEENLTGYADAGSISHWAVQAMQWAVGSGLIKGVTDTTLAPSANATRAQVATIIMRFCELIIK